ncbi:hypothetical protein [Endozoicomonas atrinae]|uniref:hypothetical protein n=1 Tax=Endozoicomonas atrinae TaxID=1333660 RepID=UPI000824A02B|nr:hypothetical protein [Endozoicomonas atrinae]
MAKLSAGQKRRQKELKRKKKKQVQARKQQTSMVHMGTANGLPKLSSLIIEYAGDLLVGADNSRSYIEGLLGYLIMTWNIGAVKPEKANELRDILDAGMQEGGVTAPDEIIEQLDFFITKRRMLFGDDPRIVLEHSISWNGMGEYNLQVVSTVLPLEDRFSMNMENATAGLSARLREKVDTFRTPLTEEEEEIERLIDRGYKLLESNRLKDDQNIVDACDTWLIAWGLIKDRYGHLTSINDIEGMIGILIQNWSAEMDMNLHNAACIEPGYNEKGILFAREFCQQYPDSDKTYIVNFQRFIAEQLLQKGEMEAAEATFEALVTDLPDETWGYIGWGDVYNPVYKNTFNTPKDIDRAKQLYRIPIVRELRHADDARERLEELIAFEREAATTMDA